MYLRALILSLGVVLANCAGADENGDVALDGAARDTNESLLFEVSRTSLLPNKMLELRARYLDANGLPQANVLVDFSITGAAAGASLMPSRAFTDSEGIATTTLRAGSTAGTLEVRARAGDKSYDTIKITVQPALGTTLEVAIRYTGGRTLSAYTVTSIPEMTCAQALSSGFAGDVSYALRAPDDTASFDLGYGLSTAIVAWGRDDAGGKLARGCEYFNAPVTADEAEAQTLVTLELTDIELGFHVPIALELELDVSTAARRFEDAATRAVAGVVSPKAYSLFADADYLLDAAQNLLVARGNTAGAAQLTARRAGNALATTLQPALSAADVGPSAYGEAVGKRLAQRGASILMRGSIASTLEAKLTSFTALSADGGGAIAFASVPPTVVEASFLADKAQLAFSQLRVDLGLGAYGKTVLANLDAGARGELIASAGCASAFASWWSKSGLTDLLSTSDAQGACVASLAPLDGAIQNALSALDAASSALALSGNVQVHDRSDEGAIDDLGPSALNGSWGSDPVQSELRVPSRTAFE